MKKRSASLLCTLAVTTMMLAGAAVASNASSSNVVEEGKKISFDRKKGNCLACHQIAGGALPGNAGPPLVAMKARYPDKSALRDQIWDATVRNPNTIMPPFGKHGILTESEIDKVVEFIYTL